MVISISDTLSCISAARHRREDILPQTKTVWEAGRQLTPAAYNKVMHTSLACISRCGWYTSFS